jgi:hypothetical protein
MKESAIKKGMPSRGKYSWTSFMKGREGAKIKDIERGLKEWMQDIVKKTK